MKVFSCGELVPGCWATFQGESDHEILRQVAVHARNEHGMDEVPPEVVDRIASDLGTAAVSEGTPVVSGPSPGCAVAGGGARLDHWGLSQGVATMYGHAGR